MIWDNAKIVSWDLETSGDIPEYALQPWRWASPPAPGASWVTSTSMICHDHGRLVTHGSKLYPQVADLRAFLEEAITEDWTVLGWNISFDIMWLFAMGLGTLAHQVKWLDAMLLWKHLEIEPEYEFMTNRHKKRSYALKPGGIERFIPVAAGYEQDVDFHATDQASLAKLQRYNDQDSVHTWIIAAAIWHGLNDRQRECAMTEAACLSMVAEANYSGMLIDTLACNELGAWLGETADALLAKLAPHGVTEKIIRSPLQLAKLLFEDWGLPVIKENSSKLTGKTSRSTDKEVLHELAFDDPRCADLRSYREALGNRAKFADGILASVDYNSDGRTRPGAIVFGTYSGRMTYASKQGKGVNARPVGFALHQEKRDPVFRSVVVAPPGYTLVEFDAAGQEYRWMAVAANDPTMLGLCMPGEDPHSYMGSRVTLSDYQELVTRVRAGDKPAEATRQMGKVANLCIAEGTLILTDRGPCSIEQVRADDLVWDGEAFVAHAGVQLSGVFPVISHMGVSATPDHKVLLVNGCWEKIEDAARYGWPIESSLGQGRARRARAAVRVLAGVIRRALRTLRGTLRDGAVCLWGRERSEPQVHGDWEVVELQGVRDTYATQASRAFNRRYAREEASSKTGQRYAAAMLQHQRSFVSQLRGAWDRVQVFIDQGRCGLHTNNASGPQLCRVGHRQDQQRWSLRAWKLALGYAQGESSQPRAVRTYDIVNCGPNTRFAANGLIVHNSLQYRTSARKLRSVARVQHNIPLELPEAQRIHKTYQSTYSQIPRYWAEQISLTKQRGWVETLAGRRVQVVGDWGGDWGWSMGSTAINYRIQGTGADQKYLALQAIKSYVLSIGGRFAWELHDGIYFYIPDAAVEHAVVDIKQLLDNLPYKKAWGFEPPIPLPWDAKTGKSWGGLKGVKF